MKIDNIKHLLEKSTLSEEEQYELIYTIVSSNSHYKKRPKAFYSEMDLPNEYISFDIETTGFSYSDKLIQISGVKYSNGLEVEYFDEYVKLEGIEIPIHITRLTGITNEDVKYADTFDSVINKFKNFISDTPLIGHNITSFELPRLLKWANLDLRNQVAVDTYNYAQASDILVDDYKLETLKHHYNIKNISHNALSDSRTTAKIYEYLKDNQISPLNHSLKKDQILANKKYCLTGFIQIGRSTMEKIIISLGGTIQNSMSKKVDCLIYAPQIAKNLKHENKSSKEIKCLSLIEQGHDIQMISEVDFITFLEENNAY